MPAYHINYKLPIGNRSQMRRALILRFLKESAGTGKDGNASRYQYTVETYGKYSIYLRRPTQLNKGFDFTVNIKGMYFKKNRRYSTPSHQDIFNALAYCLDAHPDGYSAIRKAIIDIYNCNFTDLSQINEHFVDYCGIEHPIQIILLAIKWLFMEQDCAYWNYSGRRMLFDRLHKSGLV